MIENFKKIVKKLDKNEVMLSFFEKDSFIASIFYRKKAGGWEHNDTQISVDTLKKYPNLTKNEILNIGNKELKKYQG